MKKAFTEEEQKIVDKNEVIEGILATLKSILKTNESLNSRVAALEREVEGLI